MLKRFALMFFIATALIVGFADVAAGQEIPNDAPAVAPVASLTINAFLVTVIVSLLIPVATGLITKIEASATVKQIVTALISAVAGVVTVSTQLDGTAIISAATAQFALLNFAIATVGYLGIYKPHDANRKLAPNTGLG